MLKKLTFILPAIAIMSLLAGCYSEKSLQSKVPQGKGLVVSPADGQILEIIEDMSGDAIPAINAAGKRVALSKLKRFLKGGEKLIIVFMRPLNKHMTLSPIEGTVTMKQHTPGRFYNLFRKDAYKENEHNVIRINGDIEVFVIQIAGFVFRRIHCNVNQGDIVKRGAKLGSIALGSAVGLIVPKECKIAVNVGDKVKVGETILATY